MEDEIQEAEKKLTTLREESNASIIIEKHFSDFKGVQYFPENINRDQQYIFPLFSIFLDYLYNTFSINSDYSNYEDLSLSIIHWLDSFTNPEFLQAILRRFYLYEICSKCSHC